MPIFVYQPRKYARKFAHHSTTVKEGLTVNTDLIIAAMQQKHVSPDQLATSCSVSRSTIERILDGQTTNPGILTMSDICVSLDLSLDDIMDMQRSTPAGAAGPSHSAELSNLYRAVIHVKDGWIKRLSIACAVLICFDMFYWIIDLANKSGGWITTQSSTVANICRVAIVVALISGVIAAIVIHSKNTKMRRP